MAGACHVPGPDELPGLSCKEAASLSRAYLVSLW